LLIFYGYSIHILRLFSFSVILKRGGVKSMLPGVYSSIKKNGDLYYRASITYKGKHISLGSYQSEKDAFQAYMLSEELLSGHLSWSIEEYPNACPLPFHKWVLLVNYRDNQIYFKNPIYLKKRYFYYYIDPDYRLKFDVDDLFYYAHHKILKRGGHLFVSDYGMQVNIMSRYGIKNYAVLGKDYVFSNGDDHDYSYHNIEIINRFHGVAKVLRKGQPKYLAKIHINGDYLIGCYSTETDAAIAYNKAANLLKSSGLIKNFPQNFIDGINEITYASIYQRLRISKKLLAYAGTINNGM
jgi:hypothetical protein